MLVLSRKMGEGFRIDKDVTVEILSIDRDKVRIGITAPKEMRIFREVILKETIDINKEATNTSAIRLR